MVDAPKLGLIGQLSRLWATVRPLRRSQITNRIARRFLRPKQHRSIALQWRAPEPTLSGFPLLLEPSLLGAATFRFLGADHTLPAQGGWTDPALSKLWRYNLHYFDDLNAQDADRRETWHRDLIARWIAENPAGTGDGWEPYPLSLRIVNWLKWLWRGHSPVDGMIESLAAQADWLAQSIEWHLLGNHLFANAKAMAFAGAAFTGHDAERWSALGQQICRTELTEQVLADGAHFERSPMYQAILLADVLDLVVLFDAKGPADLAKVARDAGARMLGWLEAMTHPDGEIAFFNDAAPGIAPRTAQLADLAARLGIGSPYLPRSATLLTPSGYVRLESGTATVLADCAEIGPSYLPGHAHADTLSFELSLFGQRVIVNGGTSTYAPGAERLAERATASHSTVELAGHNSSDVWGSFRVGRRAHPGPVSLQDNPTDLVLSCSHDGYGWLPGHPVHHRSWMLGKGQMAVDDRLAMRGSHASPNGLARFKLHPRVHPTLLASDRVQLDLADGQSVMFHASCGKITFEEGIYAPAFGMRVPTIILAVALDRGQSRVEIEWPEPR